ncbi:MAG: hypothetical protein AAGD38_11005 [Acidobacteriota bacterium]
MKKLVLVDGDKVVFQPNFGAAVVVPRPGQLHGSGPGTVNGKKICVDGDESSVEVSGCTYMTPQYSIPGVGTLKIAALAADHKATKTCSGGKTVLLKGSRFTATFEVQSPAQQPPPGAGPPTPDPLSQYVGQGAFLTTNTTFRGA